MKPFSSILLLALLPFTVATVRAEPATWRIDPEHFSIAFDVAHIGYQRQIGLFRDAEGSFRYDPEANRLLDGRVVVRAGSVFTDHDERDAHLRADDFLHVQAHPEIVFEATEWAPADGGGTLAGELTLLGTTHPVELDVTINKRAEYPFGHGEETLGVSARATIKRSRWGMDYAVDNGLVGDDVALRFEFEAIRQ
ncbi:MAG: YceI family protein [Candidatus Wenzhouxiangella sp. M2_3B_020]